MKKEILISFVCVSIMFITPFTVVAHENKVSSNLTDEPDIEGLVAQIGIVIDEILQKYGHIPMVRNLCNMILNALNSIGLLLFCIFLIIITLPLVLILFFIFSISEEIPPNLGPLVFILVMIFDGECYPDTSLLYLLSPLKTLSTLIETNNILKLDCPCLEG